MSRLRRALALAMFLACAVGCSRRTKSGTPMWELRRGGDLENAEGQSVAVDVDGNVYAAWRYKGTIDLGAGPVPSRCAQAWVPADLVVAKLSPSGAHVWSKQFPCVNAAAVAVAAGGGVVIAGNVTETIDFGGGPMSGNGSVNDVVVAKLDASGGHVWSRRFRASNHAAVKSVAVDAAGTIAIGGSFYESVDFGDGATIRGGFSHTGNLFLAKLDANGKHVWSRAFETEKWQECQVAFTPSGELVFAGSVRLPVDFGTGKLAPGAFLVKLDRQNQVVRAKTYGGSERTYTEGLSVSPEGDAVITGVSDGSVDFGSGPLCGGRLHADEAWIARFGDDGALRFAKCFQGHQMLVFRADSITWGVASDASGIVLVGKLNGGTVDFGGGSLSGDGRGFLLMLDPAGRHRFSRLIGAKGDLDDNVSAIAIDRAGNPIYVGTASHSVGNRFPQSIFAAKLTR
jgi:hypothetical protein